MGAGLSKRLRSMSLPVKRASDYLQRRVKGIALADAGRLAEELGDLPLALEQAAALLTETVMTVDMYLHLLAEESERILGENPPPSDYPVPVAAAWSLSVTRLREQTPYAMELLQRCAFFGPAPIPLELLDRGRYVLEPPLARYPARSHPDEQGHPCTRPLLTGADRQLSGVPWRYTG